MDTYVLNFPFGDDDLMITYTYEEWVEHHPYGDGTAIEEFSDLEIVKMEHRTPIGDWVEIEPEFGFLYSAVDSFCCTYHHDEGALLEA